MLDLPALLPPKSTVIGARRMSPVSDHTLKFLTRRCVSTVRLYPIRVPRSIVCPQNRAAQVTISLKPNTASGGMLRLAVGRG